MVAQMKKLCLLQQKGQTLSPFTTIDWSNEQLAAPLAW
jgi:hypothetical protein